MTESRRPKTRSTDPRLVLEDFLGQFSRSHGSTLTRVTDDILGFEVTPALQSLLPNRKIVEFPLILSQAVDPAAEDSSCRDLAKLVELAINDGSFCHVACEPRITIADASIAAAGAAEALGPRSAAEEAGGSGSVVTMHPFALLNYRVVYRHVQDEVIHPVFVFDLSTGRRAQAAESILHEDHPWESKANEIAHAVKETLFGVHDEALAELDLAATRRIEEIRQWLEQQDKDRRDVMESYFDELAKELEEERRSVYYHLYFFEKEQEIEEKIKRIQDERAHRKGPPTPPIKPSATLDLINLGVFMVPFATVEVDGRRVEIDLLEGRVFRAGGRYVVLD